MSTSKPKRSGDQAAPRQAGVGRDGEKLSAFR